ncbi:PadR family transcriptional regulator [Luteococcus peritonei]
MLGLLVDEPRHGYELDSLVQAQGLDAWLRLPSSSIYFVLKRLAGKEFIAPVGNDEKSQRQRYRITDRGLERMRQQVSDCLCQVDDTRENFRIACLMASVLDEQQLLQCLQVRRRAVMEKIAQIGSRRSRTLENPQGMALLDHELGILRAELGWLDKHQATIGRPQLSSLT